MAETNPNDETIAFVPLTQGSEIGPYRIIRELGVGGMGEVYLAEDNRLERQVALKFLSPHLAGGEEFRSRFMREAKSAARLNHNNVVTVYEVGEDNGRIFLAMEYVEGLSLRELIDTRAFDYGKTLTVFKQVCRGLKKAHDSGVVHRDLKPANIMYTSEEQVKILDFGLAKGTLDANLTSTGAALGTVNYMSPEQAQGEKADARSDIFSAGVLLFELLTGVNPFVRGHLPATIHAIVYEPVGQISDHKADLPADCQTLIDKAVGKRPEDRYQIVDELLADLEKLESGQAITPAAVAQPEIARSEIPTVAVLVLQNLGAAEDDYLCYGITEDLIIDLSKVNSMRVVPTHKVMKYRDSNLDPEEIARKLGAPMVMYGSLHRSDTNIRVSAQLVDIAKDEIVWSDRWEESTDNLPRIKTALAKGISAALEVDSSVVRKADVGTSETSNPEAYDLYLKGKYAFDHRKSKGDVDLARKSYRQALTLEPTMISARVGLAEIHSNRREHDKAKEILQPALEEARQRGLLAEEARVLTALGFTTNRLRDHEGSIELLQRAIAIYKELRDTGGEARAIVEMFRPMLNAGKVETVLGMEERLSELAEAGADSLHITEGLSLLGSAYARSGNTARAVGLLEDALSMARANNHPAVEARILQYISSFYAAQGSAQLETAMAYLEEARFITEKLEDTNLLLNVEFRTAYIEMQTGALPQVFSKIDRLWSMAEAERDTIGLYSLAAVRSRLLFWMGRYQESLDSVAAIRATAGALEGSVRKRAEADALFISGLGRFATGDRPGGKAAMEEARQFFEAIDDPVGLAENLPEMAVLLLEAGDTERARELLTRGGELIKNSKDIFVTVLCEGILILLDLQKGKRPDGIRELRGNVDRATGHLGEVPARRLLGQALLEFGTTDEEREEGRRVLMQALGLARRMEFVAERDRIQKVLERHG